MLDLFAHDVEARLPPGYIWRGRVAGNLVSQLGAPSIDRRMRFIERRIRDRRIYVGDTTDGERIALAVNNA